MGSLSCGVVHHPIVGEVHCGDAYVVVDREDFFLVAVADGLGHGSLAEEAAHKVMEVIKDHPEKPPVILLQLCHQALRGTRGAVLAIARVDRKKQTLIHAGLGNIDTRIVTAEKVYHPVTVNGIVGHTAPKFRSEQFAFKPGDVLIMHSDGISDRFEVSPRTRERDLQMLANQIAQEFGKIHDDQLLLLVKEDA